MPETKSKSDPTFRWGIAATGRIAEWFATDFPFAAGGEIVAVCSRSKERAADFAQRFDLARAYGSYQELLDDDGVDVVYVATPHSAHLDYVERALQAGKSVLCEKPLTVTAQETERLIEVSEATGGYLMEAMWTYFLPAIRNAQRWVAEGRIGRLVHVKADFGYPVAYQATQREYDPAMGGGALLEMGVYPVALAWLFTQQTPETIQVTARKAPNGVEDDLVAVFDYGDHAGVTATLGTSFRCKLRNWAYLVGDEGYIAIPDFWRAHQCHLYHLDERIDTFDDGRTHQGFSYQVDAVHEDLRHGRRQSEIVSLTTSLAVQRHMDWIRRQASFRRTPMPFHSQDSGGNS